MVQEFNAGGVKSLCLFKVERVCVSDQNNSLTGLPECINVLPTWLSRFHLKKLDQFAPKSFLHSCKADTTLQICAPASYTKRNSEVLSSAVIRSVAVLAFPMCKTPKEIVLMNVHFKTASLICY